MSDEEDLDDGSKFKVKTPTWRSRHLSELISKLDKRREEDGKLLGKQVLRKARIPADSPMKRMPSKRLRRCHLQSTDEDRSSDDL